MRSGITSYAILLPLLAGLAERALAAPQPASVTLIAGSKYDTTAYCSADGADGRQVFGSQDQVPNVIACAGWEGVQGDFGDSQSVSTTRGVYVSQSLHKLTQSSVPVMIVSPDRFRQSRRMYQVLLDHSQKIP